MADVNPAEIIDLFREDIDAGSFNVAALVADDTGCDWAYSVGLHRCHDHPELLIVGLDAPIAGAVIEVLGKEIGEGRRLTEGTAIRLLGGLELQVRSVDELWLARGDWFELGREVMSHWGERWPETLQLVWSDASGAFPEHPGDPSWSFRQPLLAPV
jgi:hypothetical protein